MSSTVVARLAYVAFFTAIGASIPFLSLFYQANGFSLAEIGLLSSLSAAVGLLGAPVWGSIADRFSGSRLVLPAAVALAAAASLALALLRGPTVIWAAVIVMALALAGIAPILDARALETVRGDRDRYAHLRVWGSASFIVAVVITGWLIERSGILSLFAVYVPALVVTALISLRLPGDAPMAPPLPRLAGIASVLRTPALRRFLLAALLAWSASMAINWFFTIHLTDIGAPGELVGAAWALGALVEIPIMWAYPALASRFGVERLVVVGAACFALRAIALVLVDEPVLVTATMVLHGAGFALLLVGGVTYVSRHAPPAAAATAQGILAATVFSLAVIIGPGIGGLVAEAWGLPAMFVVSAAVGLGAIVGLAVAVSGRSATRTDVAAYTSTD